jgi:protein-disulfide isomerase
MRIRLTTGVLIAFLTLCAASVADELTSLMPPPPGARVAIVLFQDLEWPDCASAYPMIVQTAQARHIPVVVHDFPMPRHNWSFQASVAARFFDTKSQQLGDDFRGYILQNQKQIGDEAALRKYTERFAAERQISLPVQLDPDGRLAAKVQTDFRLGQRIGVEHTPTLFVVGPGRISSPLVETVNGGALDALIDDMQKRVAVPVPAKAPARQRKRGT